MNFKKIIVSAVAIAAFAGFTGAASAAIREVNEWGASAQFLYWSAQAPNYLQNIGCYNGGWTKTGPTSKYQVSVGTCANGDTFIFRVGEKSSFDGPLSVMGSTTDPNRGSIDPQEGCGDANPRQRLMTDETTCSGASCTARKCVDITVGASDVEGESFTQVSHGMKYGPSTATNNVWIDRAFSAIDTSSLANTRKLVVPFGEFVNNTVTKNGVTIDNLTRHQVVQIYSGQAWYWQDFGGDYTSLPITRCFRHAGSGTHATLDKTVMHSPWGGALLTDESLVDPLTWFNDSSSDLMKCINTIDGAIGYADADQIQKVGAGQTYPNVSAVKYNGVMPTRATIANGEYDNHWAVQNCYYRPTDAEAAAVCNAVKNVPSSKAGFWATTCEMTYMKDKDWTYPVYVGATCEAGPSCSDGLDNDFDGSADAADTDCQ
ncbi:MAG: hypothetical protein C4581_00570 [Nitrospiraceae bacterium]|nr:MAG: hypothetical protein C4581_00570 [Nitrospiraceae bacterium]